MTERNIPLETMASPPPLPPPQPPPEYRKTQGDGPDAVHNHYHIGNERGPTPWYRRKWALWSLVGLLVFVVVMLVIMGVVLKVELGKKAGPAVDADAPPPASSATETASPTLTATPRATATPFTMLDRSQLASAFVKATDPSLNRRLLVRQEDTRELLVTEWAGGQMAHYRIKDRLKSLVAEAKPGTPLAVQADEAGTVHLFYLSRTNILSYLYEPKAGEWKAGEVSDEKGSIRASEYSSLSTALHYGKKASGLLVVAFDDPHELLQLAMTDSPTERGSWYVGKVTSVSRSSEPGQSNLPCYSLAGDWFVPAPKNATNDVANQNLVVAVADGSEVHAWECAVDYWPPPNVQVKCKQVDDQFEDKQGARLRMVPPPTQFAWISRNEVKDTINANWDYILLSQDGSGQIGENWVGRDITRKMEKGFKVPMDVKAMSTTSEGMVFVSTGKDVYVYSKEGSRWQPDVATNVTFKA